MAVKHHSILGFENIALAIILIVAFVLRVFNAGFSFSNDELSALLRLQFDNPAQLLHDGVLTDFHPAGVQLFLYYWSLFAGNSEVMIRFPFILASVAATAALYFLGKQWFNPITGLIAASAYAMLQFPLLYGQIARPYAPGSLFVLLSTLLWTSLLFGNNSNRRNLWLSILLSVSFAASLYTHYFAGLMSVIIGLTGLFFMKKENRFYYLGAGILTAILFLPHLGISIEHLSKGGLKSWLGPPDNTWLTIFLKYALFQSSNVLIIFIIPIVYSAFSKFNKSHLLFRLVGLGWFFGYYLTAHLYSVFVNPVLQNNIMLFAFPFLLLVMSSTFRALKAHKAVILTLFCLILLSSTLIENKFYQTYHFANFKGVGEEIREWEKLYGKESLQLIAAVNNPWYIKYYLNDESKTDRSIHSFLHHPSELLPLLVHDTVSEYLAYARLKTCSDHTLAFLKVLFPETIEERHYGNRSEVYFLGRKNQLPLLSKSLNFIDTLTGEPLETGEFSPGFEFNTEELSGFGGGRVELICRYRSKQPPRNACLVLHLTTASGDKDIYESFGLNRFHLIDTEDAAFTAISLPDPIPKNSNLKAYIWNPDKQKLQAEFLNINFYHDKN